MAVVKASVALDLVKPEVRVSSANNSCIAGPPEPEPEPELVPVQYDPGYMRRI
jgi:hypothetical protein